MKPRNVSKIKDPDFGELPDCECLSAWYCNDCQTCPCNITRDGCGMFSQLACGKMCGCEE